MSASDRPTLAPLFDELANHLSGFDLATLGEVIADIERRVNRFRARRDDRE